MTVKTLQSSIFICFLQITNYSKFVGLKIKSIFVKDFFIPTKVRLKRMEHLLRKGIISCELYFSSIVGVGAGAGV